MSHNAALLQQLVIRNCRAATSCRRHWRGDGGWPASMCGFTPYGMDRSEGSDFLQWVPLFSAANIGDVRSLVSSSLLPAYALMKTKPTT